MAMSQDQKIPGQASSWEQVMGFELPEEGIPIHLNARTIREEIQFYSR
jgi:hypothetical protein